MHKLESDLQKEKAELERMKKDGAAKLEEWDKRLRGEPSSIRVTGSRAEVEYQFELWQGVHETAVQLVQANIDKLQEQYDQQTAAAQEEARAYLAAKKEEKLKAWLLQGGTKETFSALWPDWEVELIRERMKAQEEPPFDMAAAMAEKRRRFGQL